jgi:hypothetical protein
MPLAAMLYGTTRLYPYGCDLRAGFTCRICTHRGCRAAGRSAGSASQTMTRRVMDVPTSDQLGGEISRLGRGRRVRPAKSWRTAWARVLKFEGPLGGLGRALLTPTAGAAPNRGSTRETHTYGDPWRRTQSVWQGSAPRRSTEVVRRPPPIASMLFGGGLQPESAREDLADTETLRRPCPKRVLRRWWTARLGELNSVTKYTWRALACEFAMPQLAVEAAARLRGLSSLEPRQLARTTIALARDGQPCRRTLRTRPAAWLGTTSRH